MELNVCKNNVNLLNTYKGSGGGLASVSAYIHHELTAEREQQLLDFVEKALVAAVRTFVEA